MDVRMYGSTIILTFLCLCINVQNSKYLQCPESVFLKKERTGQGIDGTRRSFFCDDDQSTTMEKS